MSIPQVPAFQDPETGPAMRHVMRRVLPLALVIFAACGGDSPTEPACTAPMVVAGEVVAPVKIYAPQPQYTEEARQARIQGVVILQATIDCRGNVEDVTVLKGLPMGLTESAVDAISQWRFEPATLNGRPVTVYYNLSVHFRLG